MAHVSPENFASEGVSGRHKLTIPDPDTLLGFPGLSRLVKSHCTIPREDTVELHFNEGSKHLH